MQDAPHLSEFAGTLPAAGVADVTLLLIVEQYWQKSCCVAAGSWLSCVSSPLSELLLLYDDDERWICFPAGG